MATKFYEDIDVGFKAELGSKQMSASEIVAFAEQYDPLPKHTNPEAAADNSFGGLIASGYHTMCIANRVVVDEYRLDIAGVAGLGIQEVRMSTPVKSGDELTISLEVTDKRLSESNPEMGLIFQTITAVNQTGSVVLSYDEIELVRRRDG